MFQSVTAWDLALLLCKLMLLAGLIGAVGGSVALRSYHDGTRAGHRRLLGYSLFSAVLGLHASLFMVLLQVGQINSSGIMGMFDLELTLMLRGTPVWESAAFRSVGFGLSALVTLASIRALGTLREAPPVAYYRMAQTGQVLAFGLLAYGFTLIGHIAPMSSLVKGALLFHVVAASVWLGMLLPLYWCCGESSLERLGRQMRAFSMVGVVTVMLLIVSGLVLLLTLLDLSELLSTSYGQLLTLKLLFFISLLGIAAQNKWRYVPRLSETGGVNLLRGSIRRELICAGFLVVLVATLSTMLGPASH